MSDATPEYSLIMGATSSLGVVLCRQLAAQGRKLILCGRNESELQSLAADLATRYGNEVQLLVCDLMQGEEAISHVCDAAPQVHDLWLLAGDMGNDNKDDMRNLASVAWINYTAPSLLLAGFAHVFEQRKSGRIAVVTSVAGDRGRQSNYPYGSAKAGLTAFTSGLRNRLCKSNVHVMTIKPGFMDTPMTYSMSSPLIASRTACAEAMIRGLDKGKDVIYVPWFWEIIMGIICHIPEKIFKKLSL